MKEKRTPPTVGGSSLLVIFSVLCLTVFALLSLSTVQANGRLSDACAQATFAYYEADAKAESILAQLRQGEVPEGVTLKDGVYSYSCPMSETQTLAVRVRLEEQSYTILCWRPVSTIQWEADDSLVVWDFQSPA